MTELTDPLPAHPYAELFPALEGEKFEALKEDIRANGQHEPILVSGGQLVEGRNRERACRELGIPLKTREWEGDEGDLLDFVVSANLHRRHLTSSQRAAVAVLLKDKFDHQATSRMLAGTSADGKAGGRGRKKIPTQSSGEGSADRHAGEATERAARAVGTNRQYVADAARLLRESTDLFGQVHRGELTIPEAIQQLGDSRAAMQGVAEKSQPGNSLDITTHRPSGDSEPAPGGDNLLAGAGSDRGQPDDGTPSSADGGGPLSGGPAPTPPEPAATAEAAAARAAASTVSPGKEKKRPSRSDGDVRRDLRQALSLLKRLVGPDAKRVARLARKKESDRLTWQGLLRDAEEALQKLRQLVGPETMKDTAGENGEAPAAGRDAAGANGAGAIAPGG